MTPIIAVVFLALRHGRWRIAGCRLWSLFPYRAGLRLQLLPARVTSYLEKHQVDLLRCMVPQEVGVLELGLRLPPDRLGVGQFLLCHLDLLQSLLPCITRQGLLPRRLQQLLPGISTCVRRGEATDGRPDR